MCYNDFVAPARFNCAWPFMAARRAVLLTPAKSSHPSPLLSRQQLGSLTPLDATLMEFPVCVASKRLTAELTPLAATLTKNPGVGAQLSKVCPLFLPGQDFQYPSQELRWHRQMTLLVRGDYV